MLRKVVAGLICLAIIFSFAGCFGNKYDTDFTITSRVGITNNDFYELSAKDVKSIDNYEKEFNYYGVKYASDSYLKCSIVYIVDKEETREEFFLEPSKEETNFYSFIDNALEKTTAKKVIEFSCQPMNSQKANVKISGFTVFLREIPKQEVFIETENYKLGVDLLWGGAFSYLEDLNSDVEAVKVDGKIKVDSNASDRYDTRAVNKKVNLINRNDTGRLVQQSYYGTMDAPYETATFMENEWRYNPVQGGNQYNDHSKIVDVKTTETEIYVKCRPLDWAKEKEFITPSYMEAWYTIENNNIHVKCRFTDFSGYPSIDAEQELPAFYCIEPLNTFVYYDGTEPFSKDNKLCIEDSLGFWAEEGYPKFTSIEQWSAYRGEFSDSFGIGIYMPTHDTFLTGVYGRGETDEKDPSSDDPTSYIAVVKTNHFESFKPIEYDYYISTGTVEEIRNNFNAISDLV
ncbi:MAG: hypothetical protein J6Q87_07225 [Clostridia bacterium]|nr:hypothetical protein [Clostridia bacterium]